MRAKSQTHNAALNQRRDLGYGIFQFVRAGKIGDKNFFGALLRQPLRCANAATECAKAHDKATAAADCKFTGDVHWLFSV